ncbi:MAG TPA: ATP-binding cassette domain-containing protein [Acidimicrobiales bacterium]|nr:ATP-binding cassette domain-containing protein [Acidimicrobiales bacterium]
MNVGSPPTVRTSWPRSVHGIRAGSGLVFPVSASASDDLVVDINNVTVVVNGRETLGPISLQINAQERWALIGPNGAGKTTLLSLAGAERHPTSGQVHVLGELIGRTDLRELRKRIGSVGHLVADRLPRDATAREVVLTGRDSTLATWWSTFSPHDEAHAVELLHQLRCDRIVDQHFGRCSQGERQRILLARSLFGRHPLLLLDEPALGVDLPGRESLIAALDDLASSSSPPTTVHVVHTLEELPRSTSHMLMLREGITVAAGPIDEVCTNILLSECFGIPMRVSRIDGRLHATATPSW